MLEYEVANPGQDDDDKDAEVKEKVEEVQQADRQGGGEELAHRGSYRLQEGPA